MADDTTTTIRVEVWDARGRQTEVTRIEPGLMPLARQAEVVVTLSGMLQRMLLSEAEAVPPTNYVG
jgi:hypothetical protein